MAHLRHVSDWPTVQVPDDPRLQDAGIERAATRQELLDQWSLVVVGEHPDGGWIMDCGRLGERDLGQERAGAWGDLPGTILTHGPPAVRYLRGPAEVQAHACRAVVYREEGSDLRGRLAGAGSPLRRSAVGSGVLERVEHREADPPDVVDAARAELASQDPESAPRVRRLRIPVADVMDSDVVDLEAEPAHRFAGER